MEQEGLNTAPTGIPAWHLGQTLQFSHVYFLLWKYLVYKVVRRVSDGQVVAMISISVPSTTTPHLGSPAGITRKGLLGCIFCFHKGLCLHIYLRCKFFFFSLCSCFCLLAESLST